MDICGIHMFSKPFTDTGEGGVKAFTIKCNQMTQGRRVLKHYNQVQPDDTGEGDVKALQSSATI